ncbi:MAG: hypothetical protein RLZZ628_883 [Bacteroidota bacterium]|jgi:hypothetical protein
MTEVLLLFEERRHEIELYFGLLEDIAERDAQIIFRDHRIQSIELDLQHILLSNAFLLLYNLVESTISGAIEAIYKEMLENEVTFDDIQPTIQLEIVDNIRKNVNSKKFVESIHELMTDIVEHHPKSTDLFSGNIDQEEIKKIAQKYGFSAHTDARKTQNGEPLRTIKKRRNELAHGFKSFKDCGKAKTFQEMRQIKEQSLLYVEQILRNIADFLEQKRYLKKK